MARSFNGTSDVITMTASSPIANWLFGTMVAVVKRGNNTNWNGPVCRVQTGGTVPESFLDISPTAHATNNALWYDFASSQDSATDTPKVLAADGWVLIAASKATGTNTVNLHYYVFNTGVWTRVAATSQADSIGITGGSVTIGNVVGDFFIGDIDVVAFFPTALSNAQMDTLPLSLANWDALTPTAMWVLDQASVATPVPDRTGNGANQSAISGTSIAATSSPLTQGSSPNWGSPTFWPGAGPNPTLRFPPFQSYGYTAAAVEDHTHGTETDGLASDALGGAKAASKTTQDAPVGSERPTGAKGSAAATSTTGRIADLPTSFRTASQANVEPAAADGRTGIGTKSYSKAQVEPASSADRPAGFKSATGATSSAVGAADQPTAANVRGGATASGVRATESTAISKTSARATVELLGVSERPLGSKLVLRSVLSAPNARDAAAGLRFASAATRVLVGADGRSGVGSKRASAPTVELAHALDEPFGSSVFRDITIHSGGLPEQVSGSLPVDRLTGSIRQPIKGGGIDGDSL